MRALAFAEKVFPNTHKDAVRAVRGIQDDHPGLLIAQSVGRRFDQLSPHCQDRFVEAGVINTVIRGAARRKDLREKGKRAPTIILISPTMRCNLTCEGCYAAQYAAGEELNPELLQRIINEANEAGVFLFAWLGGEPFVYKGLTEFAMTNPDSYFLAFTNGTALTPAIISQLAEAGNVAPMLSLEGTPEMTDARRGPGIHTMVMDAMARLAKAGVPFGYSTTVTRANWQTLISPEFVDPLIAIGAVIGWHFLYMPIGREPNPALMPTPEEREAFRQGILRLRATHPYFPVDFWGDAPWVGGCIAGKHYMHITSEGWVEPCVFTHFATHNIRGTSLLDAFNSPYFTEIRRRQPFNSNLLRPCMWLDNPTCSREIMAVSGAHPTHDGGDVMLTELRDCLESYAAEVGRVLDPMWEEVSSHGPDQ